MNTNIVTSVCQTAHNYALWEGPYRARSSPEAVQQGAVDPLPELKKEDDSLLADALKKDTSTQAVASNILSEVAGAQSAPKKPFQKVLRMSCVSLGELEAALKRQQAAEDEYNRRVARMRT